MKVLMELPFKFKISIIFLSLLEGAIAAHRFGYTKEHQRSWHHHSETCKGTQQSPIHIVSHRATPLPLAALEMVGYHNLLPRPLRLSNNGHSVSLKSEGVNLTDFTMPSIFGALLFAEYELESLHFHWGQHNYRGSEHKFNGITFPMEMHIIHRNMNYESVGEALKHQDGLTVLAFFFQLREKDNRQLDPLLKNFRYIKSEGDTVHLHTTFTLASLLPRDLEIYYTYRGSLTTPPCSEAVTWLVFPEAVPISFQQMKMFRRISSGGLALVDNYRLVQPLGRRRVFVRKMWANNEDGRNLTKQNSYSWLGQ